MPTIYGEIKIDPNEYIAARTQGSTVLYDATMEYVRRATATMQLTLNQFVEGTTTDHQKKYVHPMGGEMDEVHPGAASPPVDTAGSWDVAFPIRNFQQALAGTLVEWQYMTAQQYQARVDGMLLRYRTRIQKEIMRALFNNAPAPFSDPQWGTLTLRALANDDGTVYPPMVGEVEDQDDLDNYVVTGYAAASISDSNNPLDTIQSYFTGQYGFVNGGRPVFVYINNAQRAQISGLTGFVDLQVNNVSRANDTEYAVGFSQFPDPAGEVIGVYNGMIISVWQFVPANYILATDQSAPAPVMQRVDPPETGLGGGDLILLDDAQNDGNVFMSWMARFGFAVGNRLNGLVVFLDAGSTYVIPPVYER